jgi:UDP-N-acetylenolpyruvoylglucosamine reductase
MPNMMEALLTELNRNRELLTQYKAIGVPGMIGAALIQNDITTGERAIANDDVVEIIRIYDKLKNNE